jgi:hypothetical protein
MLSGKVFNQEIEEGSCLNKGKGSDKVKPLPFVLRIYTRKNEYAK